MRFRWSYIILYSIAGVIALLPFRGTDVAVLSPAEAVWASVEAGIVCLKTDGGDLGMGATVAEALENMKQTASGTVFLDTADYLLISESCTALLPALMTYLRPSCVVCLEDGSSDMEQVGAFLEYHKPELTLVRYKAGEKDLPRLRTRDGRMELVS
jgi:hypothetical protein